MTLLHKIGIAVLVLGLIGGGYWYLIDQLGEKNERIGELEAEQRQLKRSLADAQEEARQARGEIELWRGLYGQLQDITKEIDAEREVQQAQLKQLQEEQDVQDYMACPMPDSLYDWVRKN